MNRTRLAAFRVERRSVSAAIYIGTHLDYVEVRQLSSARDKAEASAIGFVNWIISTFPVESAAVEKFENGDEILRALLTKGVRQTLRDNNLPIAEISKQELFAAFGYPPARSRKELRQVITTIWPMLSDRRGSASRLDAVALGLFVQTEYLFQH